MRKRGWEILVDVAIEYVSSHHSIELALADEILKWEKLVRLPRGSHVGEAIVRVGVAAAMTWEVLHGASHIERVMRVDKPFGIVSHHGSVGREAAMQFADYRAIGVDVDVDVGRKIHVDARLRQFLSYGECVMASGVGIVDFA